MATRTSRSPIATTTSTKTPAKKTPTKKTPAKKTPAKKTPAKKTPTKKQTAKKAPAKKTPAKKQTWTPGQIARLESRLKQQPTAAGVATVLAGLGDARDDMLVARLYNLGIAMMGRPGHAFAINAWLTRGPVPLGPPGRRRQYLQALNNGLYAALQERDDAHGLLMVERVGALGPELPSILHNVACVFARAGRDDDAARAIDEAVAAGYASVHLLVADDDLMHLMARDDVRATLARRNAAIEALVQDRVAGLAPSCPDGVVPDDVVRLWRMLLGHDARLGPEPEVRSLTLGDLSIVLVEDPTGVPLPRPLGDGVVPLLEVDDGLALLARHEGRPVFVVIDEDGHPRAADRSLVGLLTTLAGTAADRAFITQVFKEYTAGGAAAVPVEAVDASVVDLGPVGGRR